MFLSTVLLALSLFLVGQAQLVQVNYYAESLCPDCISFSIGAVDEAISQIGSIFSLRYIPSGNAKLLSDGTLSCQHGPMECLINKVEACLVHYYPSRDQFWPFVHCMDQHGREQNLLVAETCSKKTNIDWDKIKACTNGPEGTKLQMNAFNVTASLNPPHTHTPWVTIDGKHNPEAEGFRFISVVCEAYKGPNKPQACP